MTLSIKLQKEHDFVTRVRVLTDSARCCSNKKYCKVASFIVQLIYRATCGLIYLINRGENKLTMCCTPVVLKKKKGNINHFQKPGACLIDRAIRH